MTSTVQVHNNLVSLFFRSFLWVTAIDYLAVDCGKELVKVDLVVMCRQKSDFDVFVALVS